MRESKNSILKVLCVIAAFFSVFALHCRWGLYESSETGAVLNFLQKLGGAFQGLDWLDIISVVALSVLFIKVADNFKFDLSALIISFFLSGLYIICRQYRDFDSLHFLFDSKFSLCILIAGLIGYTCLIYAVFVCAKEIVLKKAGSGEEKESFLYRFFLPISWIFIFLCYFVWIMLSYPGSAMPDTVIQFKNYLGDTPWSTWQPPFSSLIMGWCYSIGRALVNANFGFFLYTLLQSVAASGIFSYAINRLMKLGAPVKFCVLSVLFYGMVPMWGGFAQWVEKDFLFAAVGVLFTTFVAEVFVRKELGVGGAVKIIVSGMLFMFLRNNGVYAVIPTLVVLCFYVSCKAKCGLIIITVSVLIAFEGVTRFLFPAVGVGATSISETIGFMFQQTARYVNTYPDELSDADKTVLVKNFQSMDTFGNYDPKFMDPVKIYYNHTAPKEYFSLWFKQFTKHPTVYVESYLNGAYGYLAPVEGDTGAYIMSEFDDYCRDRMGLSAGESATGKNILIAILNSSKYQVLIKYFTYPGAYTWWLVLCLYLLAHKKKKGAWCVFIPGIMTVLVCTVAPLACATRYSLLVAASAPLIAGWVLAGNSENKESQTA